MKNIIIKTTSDRSCRIVACLLVAFLCGLASVPLIGAEEAAGQAAAPAPALTASEQAAADALIAKHGKDALAYCPMWVDKEVSKSQVCNTVEHLVSKGADINAKDENGCSPLYLAAPQKNLELVKYVVSLGLDVHAKNNKGGTPLHDAAKENKNEAVYDFLVSNGADADAADNNGFTPRALKPRSRPAAPKGW